MKYSLIAHSNELRYICIDPIYWHKRPKLCRLNINITSACALHNLRSLYCKDIKDYNPEAKVKQVEMNRTQRTHKIPIPPKEMNKPKLDIKDIVTFDKVIEKKTDDDFTVAPKFYDLTDNELNTLKKIKKMSIDRVKNLKLPNLLRFESYNFYVLRMKTMGVIPFHLDFFKKKFGVFLDWIQVTIFEELGVNLKIDVTRELTNDVPLNNA
ncbi:uncharacterized protein LOC132945324 [Metopolophium dirhodum]|uniref:uncharacterized protein LOC132945324 n=1 Tax=Metopolophium dirhodum TaxID=44670 RepID=UPI002990635E|nr:uncharacterized protein LOC132945324 [Metopolophium dirhodum]